MMSRNELRNALEELGLTQTDAAQLLSVDARTLRRWLEPGGEVPGGHEQAIRAWRRLQKLGHSWRPNVKALGELSDEETALQVHLHRNHVLQLDDILRRVEKRGGPIAPWEVDLENNRARLGPITIYFYRLALLDGGFSPSGYHRADDASTLERDQPLIEDGVACIAAAIRDDKESAQATRKRDSNR